MLITRLVGAKWPGALINYSLRAKIGGLFILINSRQDYGNVDSNHGRQYVWLILFLFI